MRSKVAIICCSFNLDKYIQSTLESILRQTEESKQIIVADAASTDRTLEILKGFEGIEVSTKPDSGYVEGFWNGARLASAKYLTQCCISDGYVDENWLQIACSYLDEHPEIDLVWGTPISLNADGEFGDVSYPELGLSPLPNMFEIRNFWKLTGFHFPEGNFVARKEIYLSCFPTLESYQSVVMEPFLEFSFNFHKQQFKSVRIPRIANFGRIHVGQLTQQEIENEKKWVFQKKYQGQILDLLREEYFEDNLALKLMNLNFFASSFFGVKSRFLHAIYMLEKNRKKRIWLALRIRLFGYFARFFMPRIYRNFT